MRKWIINVMVAVLAVGTISHAQSVSPKSDQEWVRNCRPYCWD